MIDTSSGTGKKAHSTRVRLIVDTGRMVLLSQNHLGTVDGKASADMSHSTTDTTLIEVGWTNSQPAVPALP
ncbi:hypothetical protein [Nonomuraea sp. LPB2021202275-12-8]|uniref:hypothetical protein n=1 Tax=Nonomuraea sp. LPB2021202275-12-8 TaxID=3120159 RepID=UPI00300C8EA9